MALIIHSLLIPSFIAEDSKSFSIKVHWAAPSGDKELKRWNAQEMRSLKKVTFQQWRGVLLVPLLEQSLQGLSTDERAQIDLIILKNSSGAHLQFPRAFMTKYPILLAEQKKGHSLEAPQVYQPVMLGSSKSKTVQTQVFYKSKSFFLAGLREIEFSNYREKYGSSFLKRRTDPVAIRGEKLFLQNCIVCHSGGVKLFSLHRLSSPQSLFENHSDQDWAQVFNSIDWRALNVYFQAWTLESVHKGGMQ